MNQFKPENLGYFFNIECLLYLYEHIQALETYREEETKVRLFITCLSLMDQSHTLAGMFGLFVFISTLFPHSLSAHSKPSHVVLLALFQIHALFYYQLLLHAYMYLCIPIIKYINTTC